MSFARTILHFTLPFLRRPRGALRGLPFFSLKNPPENPTIFLKNFGRNFSTSTVVRGGQESRGSWKLANLKTRSVLRVFGKDSAAFLQGLITNDVHLLDASEDGGPRSIYTFMLSIQGRILFDLFIYNDSADENGGFLVDCDALVQDKLVKHLKMYKLRKEVIIEATPSHKVQAIFPENVEDAAKLINQSREGQKVEDAVKQINQSIEGMSLQFRDPRLSLLGHRLVLGQEAVDFENFKKGFKLADEVEYRRFRYQVGVAEGSLELPPGECFPFESNGDYLSGVHFLKGCYLGQELTARTYHTGVVRKRLMPIVIEGLAEGGNLTRDSAITAGVGGKSVGKLRAHLGMHGIALMRISEALAADTLVVSQDGKTLTVRVRKPEWWLEPH